MPVGRTVVLVTGVPGSGKTTLARQLAPRLGLPLLCLDSIKETLFGTLGVRDRDWSLQLRTTSLEILWALLPDFPRGAVLDVWLDPRRDDGVAQNGLARAGVAAAVEVLCEVPGHLAAQRYAARDRHPGHLPPDENTLARIREAASLMAPLGIGPTLRVDTSREVDAREVAAWCVAGPPLRSENGDAQDAR